MEGKFYKTAITGDEDLLNQLVDSISVDGAEFVKETPLHIAAKYGHRNIVREILRRRPGLTFKLNSEQQAPLYLASAKGHLDAVKELLDENNNDQLQQRMLLDACFIPGSDSPLHIAAEYGHLNIVREILSRRPEFAFRLNSKGQTPLHLASAKGHLDSVKELLDENNNDQRQQRKLSDACFIRDSHGRSPLHLATIDGHVQVLKQLVETESAATWVCTDRGESLLHLCADNGHFNCAEELIGLVFEKKDFINLKDDDGNNVLHLLAANHQYKMINRLVKQNTGVDINGMNRDGETVLDVALKNVSGNVNLLKIGWSLESIGAKTAKEMVGTSPVEPQKRRRRPRPPDDNFEKWLSEMKQTLMVVAILMATVTYQAILSPPGGLWQDDLYFDNTTGTFTTTPYVVNATGKSYSISTNQSLMAIHKAGTPIMSDKYPLKYASFAGSNSLGFSLSVVLIILLARGYSSQEKAAMWLLTILTMLSVICLLSNCAYSILLLSHQSHFGILTRFSLLASRLVLLVPLAFAGILMIPILFIEYAAGSFEMLVEMLFGSAPE